MIRMKAILSAGVMTVAAVATGYPAIAQPIPPKAANACTQRTAEEMVVATRDIEITGAGPVSAESGARTLFMRNRVTGQTAECRVNTIDGTVLSVRLTSQQPKPPQTVSPALINACIQRTAEEMVVPARDIDFVQVDQPNPDGTTTVFLRNRVTGMTANCLVNPATNTVIRVTTTPAPKPVPPTQPPTQGVSQALINACIQRTAEEMVVAARDIEFVQADPLNADGTRTLFLRNRVTGMTANCLVNPATNTVIRVTVTPATKPLPPSQGKPASPNDPLVRNCQAVIGRQIRGSFTAVQSVTFLSNTTQRFFISNTQEGIRGEGQFAQRSKMMHRFNYNCVVNIRNGSVQSANFNIIR